MNARLFPGNWRPFAREVRFAAELGFDCLQLVGYDLPIDEARLGEPLSSAGARLAASGLAAVIEIVARVDRDGRTPSGGTPLDALHVNLPAIRALGAGRVHLHVAPIERLDGE